MHPTNVLLSVELEDQVVIAQAADHGFRLVRLETEHGHTVWEWRNGDQPRPQFVTRRVAVHWMSDCLARDGHLASVSDVGERYDLRVN
jgi:hypothetical protein